MIPKEENGLIGVVNAVRQYVGIPKHHVQDTMIQQWLEEHHFQQVIVLLIDGMGAYQIENYCEEYGFLKTHMVKKVDTVYPPTTVAATTAVLTGKYPCETGWLAWQQYFPSIDQHNIMFFNENYYTEESLKDPYASYRQFPITTMVEDCVALGIPAKEIFPAWRPDGVRSFSEMCERLVMESRQLDSSYIYAYWDGYDSFMHNHGATHQDSIKMLREFDDQLETMVQQLSKGTGMIILADHGHIDVLNQHLVDYPDVMECFEHLPAFETRTLNFFIKDQKKEKFVELFQRYFKDNFKLYTKQEVLDQHLFGFGKEHPQFQSMLGDYLACATGNFCLNLNDTYDVRGHHAGMTKKEMEIPIVLASGCRE